MQELLITQGDRASAEVLHMSQDSGEPDENLAKANGSDEKPQPGKKATGKP